MSLEKKIAKNTFIQISGKLISTVLGLIAVAIMGRTLKPEQFGWYVTSTGFLQFIGILIDFGFTVTTSNMLAEPEYDKDKLFNTIFTWRFVTALFFFGIAPIIFIFFPYSKEIKMAVGIISLSFFAITISQVFIGYYREQLNLVSVTVSEIIGRVVLVAGIASFSIFKAGFLPIMSTITLASLVSTAYLWFKFGRVKFLLDLVISKALFYKIWPTALSVIFNSLYLQADRVILPLYISQAEVGMYGAAYRVLDIIIQIAAIVMGMVMPLITFAWSRNLFNEFKERYHLAVNFLSAIILPIIVGIFVLSEDIMLFIFGGDFSGSGIMLRWLSISILGTCFGMIFGHIVLAINRQKEALYIYGSDAIISLIGYFIFIPRFGWQGAAAVTIFSEIYAGIFLTILSIKHSKVKPEILGVGKILFASLLMGFVVSIFPKINIILSILVGIITYSVMVVVFKIIKPLTLKQIFRSKVAEI